MVAAGADLGGPNVVMVLLLAVLLSGVAFGRGPGMVAAVFAAVTYNYFFLEPRFTFTIAGPSNPLTFAVFLAIAVATGWLAGRVRDQASEAARRAEASAVLLDASRDMSAAATGQEAAQALSSHASRLTGSAAVVLLGEGEALALAAAPPGVTDLGPATMRSAQTAWQGGAGGDADEAGWVFHALAGLRGGVGVVGLRGPLSLDSEAEARLEALLRQGGIAIERAQLVTAASENEALKKADQLRAALLNSISHDFRTPLAGVLGSATTLLDFEAELKPAVRRDLLKSIAEDVQRIDRYVDDLLGMGRLEGGALQPRKTLVDLRAIIGASIGRIGDRLGRRRIRREIAPDLSLVEADATLLGQVVINLLENALIHAPGDTEIIVAAHEDAEQVVLAIDDAGPGIAPADLPVVFDKFRRLEGPSDRAPGLGLGLSIAKGFVEAMGGRIAVASPLKDGKGTRFIVSLPKSRPTPEGLL